MMGTAMADGPTRALDAANRAVSSPLLEDASVNGARGVIVNITGGPDMGLMEVHDAMSVIQEAAHEDANIIFGAVVDPTLTGKVKITVIATGFDQARHARTIPAAASTTPVDLSNYTAHLRTGAGANAIDAAHAPRATISRRPSIDMPLQQRAVVGGTPLPSYDLEPGEVDLTMELDVPAFLRRQNE